MKNLFLFIGIFCFFGFKAVSAAEGLSPSDENQIWETRQLLSPVVDSALRNFCGKNCPSFKIEFSFPSQPKASKSTALGFSDLTMEPHQKKKLEDGVIRLSVVTHDHLSKEMKSSLRQILAHKVKNSSRLRLPVVVQFMAIPNSYASLAESEGTVQASSDRWMGLASEAIWPFTVLMLAILAIFSFWVLKKQKKDSLSLKDGELSPLRSADDLNVEKEREEVRSKLQELLKARTKDFHWWIEDLCTTGNSEDLKRILSFYTASEFSSNISFSGKALGVLSRIEAAHSSHQVSLSDMNWLSMNLDQAHWKRLFEKQNPVAGMAQMNTKQSKKLLEMTKTAAEKAMLLRLVPVEKWPDFLVHMNSSERVEVGFALSLASSQVSVSEEEKKFLSVMSSVMSSVHQSGGYLGQEEIFQNEGSIEDYSIFLSQSECQDLWMKFRAKGSEEMKAMKRRSAREMVFELGDSELREICLKMDFETLALFFRSATSSERDRLLRVMPQGLSDRIGRSVDASIEITDSERMRASVKLAKLRRQLST